MKCYINGLLVQTATSETSNTIQNPNYDQLYLGRTNEPLNGVPDYANVTMDELMFYEDSIFTAESIADMYLAYGNIPLLSLSVLMCIELIMNWELHSG